MKLLLQTVNLIVYFISFANGKLTASYNLIEIQQRTVDCALRIAKENFDRRKVTVILHKNEDEIVNLFLESYDGVVFVENKYVEEPTKQVVIIVDTFKSFMKIVNKIKPDLKGKSLLNSGAKFLIVLENPKKIERVCRILWSYFITDVVIVTKNIRDMVSLYTYYPYQNPLNCHNTQPTVVSSWNKTTTLKNVYPDKLFNMNKCPLYVSTSKIKYPFAEKKIPLETIKKTIVRLLRDIMNFTPIVSVKEYISIDSNRARNWSDSLSDVIAGVANLSTSSIPLGIDRLGLLDYSTPYFRERLVWLAPPVAPGPGWWRLLSPLNGYLWLALLLVIFFVKLLPFTKNIKPIKRFCFKFFKRSIKLRRIAFRVWGILVGQPIKVVPRRFRDFYIVGLWMWFSFVVRSCYQSVLIGALKTDTVLGNFANIRDIVDAGYEIGGRAGIYSYFEYDLLIRERFKVISDDEFETIFFDVIEGRRHFALATSLEYAFAYCLAVGKTEKECGHILADSIMFVPLVVWMKLHSPFKKPLAVWLPRMIESGLLQFSSQVSNPYSFQIHSEPSPLTHHQVLSCMLCLCFGYIVSVIVFIAEVARNKAIIYTIDRKRPFRN